MNAPKSTIVFVFFILWVFSENTVAQSWIRVEPVSFGNKEFDEAGPVFFNGGILFCWNKKNKVLVSDLTQHESPLFDIYFVKPKGGGEWSEPVLFSAEITTRFHEGPLCVSADGREIYFTQNITRSMHPDNKVGIFRANLDRVGNVSNVRPFRYNVEGYNVWFPTINAEGTVLIFSSDQPGGFGGDDLYMCTRERSTWSEPVNLGEKLNTRGNEVAPFLHPSGRLYFATNGRKGLGKHDIYYTELIDGEWIEPVNLGEPINSKWDDYSIILDEDLKTGYFTSRRERSADIFSIEVELPEFETCNELQENNYCFEFFEAGTVPMDSTTFKYEWDLGDGTVVRSESVFHCFEGPGIYNIQLNLIDTITGEILMNEAFYEFNLEDIQQAYITAPDTVNVDQVTLFSAEKTYLTEFQPEQYYWDFGDKNYAMGGKVEHQYRRPGVYKVSLAAVNEPKKNESNKKSCTYKYIVVTKK